MTFGLICKLSDARQYKLRLEKEQLVDKNCKPIIQQDEIIFPLLTKDLPIDLLPLMKSNIQFTKKKKHQSLQIVLRDFLEKYDLQFDLKMPQKYEKFDDFVLFPFDAFSDFQEFFQHLKERNLLLDFFQSIQTFFQCRYLAMNAPILPDDSVRKPHIKWLLKNNELFPVTKYYEVTNSQSIMEQDLDVFWTSTLQNQIYYHWAPEYTMFSSGNITEKMRISKFNCKNEIILDLYAGIGYFTFPYILHTGASKVIACEWNPWSVLGLRKGLKSNDISFRYYNQSEQVENNFILNNEKVFIMEGNNEIYMNCFKSKVNRVNLGLLPTSEQGYTLAIQALVSEGGWLHIHENILDSELEQFVQSLEQNFETLFFTQRHEKWNCRVKHIERVKSFRPRVYHYVLDMYCIENK